MRKIKFRGKRLDNGEWVYGAYFCLPHNDERNYIHHFIIPDNGFIPKEKAIGEIQVEIIPETLGQYIGIKDKSAKDIYEGDIITTDLQRQYLIVEYRNGAFMLNCNDGLEDYYDMFFGTSEEPKEVYKYGEVIGNIYENPELMA